MLLFSQIIGRPVVDAKGTILGRLKDLIASGGSFPAVKALVIEGVDHRRFTVAWELVTKISRSVQLSTTKRYIVFYDLDEGDILLSEQVLDRQLTDMHGHKVGRVNDIQLGKTNSHYRVLALDPSTKGLFRRLGIDRAISFMGIRPEDHIIPWEKVQLTDDPTPSLRIIAPRTTIPKLHPSDLAEIVDQLSVRESSSLIEAMDDETAADTLEEVSERRQVQILKEMESGRAADILEEMSPDDAADVLADLPPSKAAELLSLMEEKESQEVRELLSYPEDSAGGIMTTEYICLPESMKVNEAIERLREQAQTVENIYYLYVVLGAQEELVGTISLRELLIARPDQSISELVDRNPVTVNLKDKQETVAKVIAKYNLLAVPVVDDQNHLQGIVTVDDAMDILLPSAWRRRLPRMFARVVAGSRH